MPIAMLFPMDTMLETERTASAVLRRAKKKKNTRLYAAMAEETTPEAEDFAAKRTVPHKEVVCNCI